jgi:hypothetical protein
MSNRNRQSARNSVNNPKGIPPTPRRKKELQMKKKKKKNQQVRRTSPLVPGFYKSPCLAKYMKALVDPFDYHSDVCVPDLDVRPSAKYRIVVRSGFGVGTLGFGYVVFSPFNMAFNNLAAGYLSLPSYTGNTVLTSLPNVGVNAIFATTAPFTTTTTTLAGVRIAAFGLRARYVGTELNRSGRLAITLTPSPYQVATGAGIGDILLYRGTKTFAVERKWVNLIWMPRMAVEYDYSGTGDQSAHDLFNKWTVLISSFDGAASNTFELEAVAYVEYVGTVVNLTPSHSDVVGLSAVRGVVGECDVPSEGGRLALEYLEAKADSYMSYATSHVISAVTGIAATQGMTAAYNRIGTRTSSSLPV